MGEPTNERASRPLWPTRTQELASHYVSDLKSPSSAEVRALVHALEVHEMELRAQNDQLQATQRDLERSHNRYMDLFESAPEGYVTLDEDGRIAEANPAAAALLGIDRRELIGTPLTAYAAPADVRALRDHLAQCRSAPGKVIADVNLTRGERGPLFVQLSTRWFPAQGDTGASWRTVITDLSGRHDAEEAVRIERDRLASVLDSMEDAAYFANQLFLVEYANPAMVREFGPPAGRKCYEWLDGRKDACPSCRNSNTFQSQRVRREWECKRTGRTYDVIGTPLRNADGTFSRLEFLRDITDRRRVHEALRELQESTEQSLALLDTLLTHAPIGILLVDRLFRFVRINDSLAAMNGLPAAAHLGQKVAKVLPDLWPTLEPFYRRALAGELVSNIEVSGETPARPGNVRRWAVSLYPVRACRDAIVGVGSIVTDITDRNRAKEALQAASAELARSNRDLQQFASIASHDLQAPLRTISGFVGLLKDRYAAQLDDKGREYIGFAVEGAKRMSQLINDLLTFARVGSRGGEFRPVELQNVIDRVLAERRAAMAESQAVVTQDAVPMIVADEGQMGQLLSNLIGNAIKYQGTGQRPEIHIGASRGEGHWRISVRDNGIGIDPKDADRVFEIFRRLHGQEEYEGTGIGLAICKRIVERHGGRIWVESRLGQGATFLFTIPDRS